MEAFLVTTFLFTFIVNSMLSFIYGKMLWQAACDYGGEIYEAKGNFARLFAVFCIIFLVACSFYWVPINTIILNNIIYSNIVSGLIGLILGALIFYRSSKFNFKSYNEQLKKNEKRNLIIVFIILCILVALFFK